MCLCVHARGKAGLDEGGCGRGIVYNTRIEKAPIEYSLGVAWHIKACEVKPATTQNSHAQCKDAQFNISTHIQTISTKHAIKQLPVRFFESAFGSTKPAAQHFLMVHMVGSM